MKRLNKQQFFSEKLTGILDAACPLDVSRICVEIGDGFVSDIIRNINTLKEQSIIMK